MSRNLRQRATPAGLVKLASVAVTVAAIIEISGCWFADKFPVPIGVTRIQARIPGDAQIIYQAATDHLQQLGFVVAASERGTLVGGSGQYWVKWELSESDGLIASLVIDMNKSKGLVMYQYEEVQRGTEFKQPPVFSQGACKIFAELDSYTAGVAKTYADDSGIEFSKNLSCS
jgi:hypothetical protein